MTVLKADLAALAAASAALRRQQDVLQTAFDDFAAKSVVAADAYGNSGEAATAYTNYEDIIRQTSTGIGTFLGALDVVASLFDSFSAQLQENDGHASAAAVQLGTGG